MKDRKAQFAELVQSTKLGDDPELYGYLEAMFLQTAKRADQNVATWQRVGQQLVTLSDTGDLGAIRRLGEALQRTEGVGRFLLPFARAIVPLSRLAVSRRASSRGLAKGRRKAATTKKLKKSAATKLRVRDLCAELSQQRVPTFEIPKRVVARLGIARSTFYRYAPEFVVNRRRR
jgi:hypothetical protein